jgi:hypothetical protein
MSMIRPLEREDIDKVAGLYELVMRSGSRNPPPGLAPYFARILLDSPWRDDEIPSLVYAEPNGEIVGFLGVHVRRMLLDGRSIRAACSGPFIVDPKARAKGIFLLLHFLKGAQDFAFTDGANHEAGRIWEKVGGFSSHLSCVRWSRIFRPFQLASTKLSSGSRYGRAAAPFLFLGKPLFSVTDAVARRLPGTMLKPPASPAAAEKLTVSNLLEGSDKVCKKLRLTPEYDEDYLDWLFREMREVRERGALRGFLIRGKNGNALGWYLYYLKPGGVSQAVQIAATSLGIDAVLDHLLQDADRGGSLALQGRVEPSLLAPLAGRKVLLQYADPLALVHTKDPEIHQCLLNGNALMTRLEGDWWMGFHLGPFVRA